MSAQASSLLTILTLKAYQTAQNSCYKNAKNKIKCHNSMLRYKVFDTKIIIDPQSSKKYALFLLFQQNNK